MGGGILPTTIYNNEIYFLFGKERETDDTPGWSDFAGGQDGKETPLDTAIREGTEELTGFLGNQEELKRALNKNGYIPIKYDSYTTHIFPFKYNEYLPLYYNNNQKFIQKKLDKKIIKESKIFEKTEIDWINYKTMIKMKKKKEFRPFYNNIVEILLERKREIEIFIRKALKNKMTKKNRNRTKQRTRKNRF